MAYRIDFTESNYRARSWRKTSLRLFLLLILTGLSWGVYDCYNAYNQPTLDMRLADYEAASRPVEEMNAAWDLVESEYKAMVKYYRLIWADNPTNFLCRMAADDAPQLGKCYRPSHWSLKTGGKCVLEYKYLFNDSDKAEQARGIESNIVAVISAATGPTESKIELEGVQLENLLNLDSLALRAKFALSDVMQFPKKEKALVICVDKIKRRRTKVQDALIGDKEAKGGAATAKGIMMAYLPASLSKGKDDFPVFKDVINVSGWLSQADKFIKAHNVPADASRGVMREAWKRVGEARFPWQRFRVLDNEELVEETKALIRVSDGVKKFKPFLDARKVSCRGKLNPLAEGYSHSDVFNQDLIESDLKTRVAASCGAPVASVKFADEKDSVPVMLVKEDEKFTFTWVRWTLSLGNTSRKEDQEDTAPSSSTDARLTLNIVADCACGAAELGPGYAIDGIDIAFDADGDVSGATITGLLPVKKSEPIREAP